MSDLVDDGGVRYRIVSKRDAALRQIRVAIKLLDEEEYEAAITLAGAAEGMMAAGEQKIAMFEHLKEQRPKDFETEKEWITFLNDTLYWLKHNADQEQRRLGEFDAWVMISRALTKYHGTFGERPQETDALMAWGRNRNLRRSLN